MGTYWTNFAKYGNPNGEGVPEWPAFTDAKPDVMYLDANPQYRTCSRRKINESIGCIFQMENTPEGKAWAK